MNSNVPSSDFDDFCDFVLRLRDSGAQPVRPEKSVENFFPSGQEKLRIWNERNAISQFQAHLGVFNPLDLNELAARVRLRLAKHGIRD